MESGCVSTVHSRGLRIVALVLSPQAVTQRKNGYSDARDNIHHYSDGFGYSERWLKYLALECEVS
jgi:hypothetical protein